MIEEFAERYGPWALALGASEGVGEVFARAVAERGRERRARCPTAAVLDEVAGAIGAATGARRARSPST